MHRQDIIELVIFLVENGPALWQRSDFEPPGSALEGYWLAAKFQMDHWARNLKAIGEWKEHPKEWPFRHQRAGLAEDILTGELLTRIWLAVLTIYERRSGKEGASALAHSVYLSHLELRGRVLAALNRPNYLPRLDVQKLVQLCERTDRWSDLLLGKLAEWGDVRSLAVDAERMQEFANDYVQIDSPKRREQTWKLMKASLVSAYQVPLFRYHPAGEWTPTLASHILACFPPEIVEGCARASFYQESRLVARCRQTEEWLAAITGDHPLQEQHPR